jgi:hypothetical protein
VVYVNGGMCFVFFSIRLYTCCTLSSLLSVVSLSLTLSCMYLSIVYHTTLISTSAFVYYTYIMAMYIVEELKLAGAHTNLDYSYEPRAFLPESVTSIKIPMA